MTLGCGGYGGNITSDNISPRHLLNIKRLAYETTPVAGATGDAAVGLPPRSQGDRSRRRNAGGIAGRRAGAEDRRVPRVPRVYSPGGIPVRRPRLLTSVARIPSRRRRPRKPAAPASPSATV